MMQAADSVSRFFNNSPKRQITLDSAIEENMPTEKRRKLKELCRTSWVESYVSFEIFIDLYKPLITCLDLIASGRPDEWNRETLADALSFLLSLSQFSFIVAIVLTQKIHSYTKGIRMYLSTKLQGFHAHVYGEALRVAERVNVQESIPRFTNSSRQSHRSNPPAESASEYYKRSLTIPMLDHLMIELDDRFNAESTLIVK